MANTGLGRRGRPPTIVTNEDGTSTIKVGGVAYDFSESGKAGRLNSRGGQNAADRDYAGRVLATTSGV